MGATPSEGALTAPSAGQATLPKGWNLVSPTLPPGVQEVAGGPGAILHGITSDIANLPGFAQIGQAARAVGGTIGAGAQAVGRAVSPVTQPIGQAAGAVTSAVGNAPGIAQIGQGIRALTHVGTVGLGSEGPERVITTAASAASGRPISSYEELHESQGKSPQEAHILAEAMRGTIQLSNLLVFPRVFVAAFGTAAAIARTTAGMARATGMIEPAAQAAGTAGRLLTEGRFTGPVIQRVADVATTGFQKVAPLINKYYGTPPAFRQGVDAYLGEIRTTLGGALAHQADILAQVPAEADRVVLGKVLTGAMQETQLPERLQGVYKNLILAERDATTSRALETGVLQSARENYMRRYYPPETLARIKAGATGPLPVPAGVAANMPPPIRRPIPSTAVPSPEVRAQQILENFPEGGRRGAFGQQVEPTRGIRGLTSGFQKGRVLSEEAATALGAIQDPAVALPAHQMEVGRAIANKNLYQRLVDLGPEWVRPDAPGVPKNWRAMSDLTGVGPAARYGWSTLRMHPQIAQAVADIFGGQQYGVNQMLMIPNAFNGALKRVIFLNPLVHGANQVKAAGLTGLRILNPRHWDEVGQMVQDAREMGAVTQARLAAGGSVAGGSIGREIGETIDDIFSVNPGLAGGIIRRVTQSTAVRKAGGVLKAPAFVRALNDEILWNVMDAGGRNYTFQHGLDYLAKTAPHIGDAERAKLAARYADLVWNDYSKLHYGTVEKALNSMLFVYPWTRGRAKLFGALARAYLPSNAADIGLYRQMAGRWAAMNVVLPHLYRAWTDKQSAGMEAARIPAATYQDQYGRTQQIYIKPTGWYNDAVEMLQDPAGFALARMNPGLKITAQLFLTMRDAQRSGKNVSQAVLESMMPENIAQILSNVYPAGLSQAITPKPVPPIYRALPALGIPVTGAPPSENPRHQMQLLIDQGKFYEAGRLAKQQGFPFFQTAASIPAANRREFVKGYSYRGGMGSGLPSLPSLPRLP